jgi:ABC-2 type transport system permease protein
MNKVHTINIRHSQPMKRIISQCVKEIVQFKRDRLTVSLAFLLPLAVLLIYGFAIRLEIKNIGLAVVDYDNSPLSRSYIERLFATNQFKPAPWVGNVPTFDAKITTKSKHYIDSLDKGIAKALVIISPDFASRIKAAKSANIQVIIDGTDVANARVIKNSIRATNQFFLKSSGLQPGVKLISTETRIWFNPGRKEALYIVPGTFAIVLAIYPPLLAAIATVKEKEQGTIIQTYASSLTASELLLGKSLAYSIIGLGEAIFIIAIGCFIWGLNFAGDPTPLIIGTPIFLFSSIQLGILIGVKTRTQSAAVQGVATVKFMTAMLLSGFIFPLSNIPFPLSLISYIVPARYYLALTRDAFVRGTGWFGVWYNIPILLLLGIVEFMLAWQTIRRMQLQD